MKNVKRIGLIAAAALAVALACLFLIPRGTPALGDNLLSNGDFSARDAGGNPVGWYKDAYGGTAGAVFEVVETEEGPAAHIVNREPKDARYSQTVEVSPNTLYCLHGFIKAHTLGGWGANLSIENVAVYPDSQFDTEGEWQEITVYGRTGESQRSVNVYVRLGGYAGETMGEAYYRDVTLSRADRAPEGASVQSWYRAPSAAASGDKNPAQGNAAFFLVLVSGLYFFFFVFLCRFLRRPHAPTAPKSLLSSPILISAVLLAALAARLAVASRISGYNVDIGCFRAWGNRMAETGPTDFYSPADPFSSCDYPPGYMWVLWVLGFIGKAMGTGTTEFMVKIPPILADIGLCAVLYREAKRQKLSLPAVMAFVCLYAFNPLTFAAGAAWGQADSLMTLLLTLTVLFALRNKWLLALPCYMAAVLFKPQALMFGPLGLAALILHIVKNWKDENQKKALLRDVGLGLLAMAGTALVIALPFSIHLPWNWLIDLYGKTMGRYAYATVNSCNFYFLLGKNWLSVDSVVGSFWIPLLLFCLAALPLALSGWKKALPLGDAFADKKERPRLIALSGLALALAAALLLLYWTGSLTYAALGTVMICYCVAVVTVLFLLGNDLQNLPAFGAVLLLILFNTGTMMHERYLFPAVALLLLGYLLKKDARLLWLAVGVTVAGFLNVGCALDRNIRIGGASGHLSAPVASIVSDMAVLEYLAAGLNVALCFAALWLCASQSRGETLPLSQEVRASSPLPENPPLRKMTRRDWLILSGITVAYAALAFTNLGSMKAPQNAYVSASPEEQIVMDLGENKQFHLLYYGGIHHYQSDFTVEISPDGQQWTQFYSAGMAQGDCFKWKYLSYTSTGTYPVDLEGRYVRLIPNHYSLTLMELLFKDAETGEILPAALADWEGANLNPTARNLLDEQDSMEGSDPGWFNSAYFDEIYHARTGYEHSMGLEPYETTHPPLGKVFISWAIGIFGMTPFGWRFAGALAGVLMLPGMYLLGKLLVKRSFGGIAAAGLMALDLMHFTQTRIATIDSFVVLFIIWMVYFMLRWFYQEDYFEKPFLKTLVPLALSGVCMGLGVASKWTGCYAGVVLAVIFFAGIWRRARQAAALEKKEFPAWHLGAKEKRLLFTVLSCLVLFVLIPALIYYVSYIPYFAYKGGPVQLQWIVDSANYMLSYHSEPGRGMDHDFYSPWYQWPVIGKPMWYSSNAFEPEGYQMSIAAMGNPAVWWGGLVCVIALLAVWILSHRQKDSTLSPFTQKDDSRVWILLLCYFGQLLPWILVPRGTYIYHYFPCVPFLILSIALCLDLLADTGREAPAGKGEALVWTKKQAETTALALTGVLLLAAAALFVFFFPYASGVLTPQSWMDACKWFSRWLWY